MLSALLHSLLIVLFVLVLVAAVSLIPAAALWGAWNVSVVPHFEQRPMTFPQAFLLTLTAAAALLAARLILAIQLPRGEEEEEEA